MSRVCLGDEIAVGEAEFDDHHGASDRIQAGPDVDVAQAGRVGQAAGEKLAGESPDHVAGAGAEGDGDRVGVARVVAEATSKVLAMPPVSTPCMMTSWVTTSADTLCSLIGAPCFGSLVRCG